MLALALIAAVTATATPTLVIVREVATRTERQPSVARLERIVAGHVLDFYDLDLRSQSALGVSEASIRGCGPEVNCLGRVLAGSDVHLVVFVIANLDATPPLASVDLFDTRLRKEVASSFESTAEVDGAVARLVVEQLERAGYRKGGRIELTTFPPTAALSFSPSAARNRGSGEWIALPGRYELLVVADGYEPYRRTLQIGAAERSTENITLVEKRSVLSSWWFWTAAGVVVVGATVGTLAASGAFTTELGCFGPCL